MKTFSSHVQKVSNLHLDNCLQVLKARNPGAIKHYHDLCHTPGHWRKTKADEDIIYSLISPMGRAVIEEDQQTASPAHKNPASPTSEMLKTMHGPDSQAKRSGQVSPSPSNRQNSDLYLPV